MKGVCSTLFLVSKSAYVCVDATDSSRKVIHFFIDKSFLSFFSYIDVLSLTKNYNYYKFRIVFKLVAICGSMILIAWAIFLFNIIMSVGIKGLIGIFLPAKDKTASYGLESEDK